MRKFLTLRTMITPYIIDIFFWLAVAACIVSGIYILVHFHTWQLGLKVLIAGPVLARIFCEVAVLPFRLYETILQIKENTMMK